MKIDREIVKDYIYGNMFDGARGGIVTMEIDHLVEEVADIFFFIFDDMSASIRPKDYED